MKSTTAINVAAYKKQREGKFQLEIILERNRMKIKKLPHVLALHLKRFKFQERTQRYVKLSYRVVFPLELRLFDTCEETIDADRLYSLFAIVVHIGK